VPARADRTEAGRLSRANSRSLRYGHVNREAGATFHQGGQGRGVDFVWDGRPYPEIIGVTKLYGWIIASHVIEHTTDLVGFLHDYDSLLKEEGVLSLAVPDIRHCFDRFRPITGIGRVIDAAGNTQKIHSVGTAAEFYLSMVRRAGRLPRTQPRRVLMSRLFAGGSETGHARCQRTRPISRRPRMVFHSDFLSTDDARPVRPWVDSAEGAGVLSHPGL